MTHEYSQRLDPVQDLEIIRLASQFWNLAQSDLPNGIAMMEMAGVLQEIGQLTDSYPHLLVRRLRPELIDSDEVSIFDTLRVAYLAENFWMSAYLRFNGHYRPEAYSEERDELKSGSTRKLELKDAGEAGTGLYAKEKIAKGELVFVSSGTRRFFCSPYESKEVFEALNDSKARFFLRPRNPDRFYPNAICIGQEDLEPMIGHRMENPAIKANLWLDPASTSPLRFLNHSCEPDITRAADGLSFVAMREIASGEPVTCDYATLEVNPDWKMDCKCGSPQCRGVIGGIQSLPDEFLEIYGTDLPPFMMDLFRASHPGIAAEVYRTLGMVRWILRF